MAILRNGEESTLQYFLSGSPTQSDIPGTIIDETCN